MHPEDIHDVDDSCDAVPPVPTVTESQAVTAALRRSSKSKRTKFQNELPESSKTFFGSMSHKGCCDAHVASPFPVVSSLVETQSHTINNPLAEPFACREALLSPRVYPVVVLPDDSSRHRDQA